VRFHELGGGLKVDFSGTTKEEGIDLKQEKK
jgi:hypothetical protein